MSLDVELTSMHMQGWGWPHLDVTPPASDQLFGRIPNQTDLPGAVRATQGRQGTPEKQR